MNDKPTATAWANRLQPFLPNGTAELVAQKLSAHALQLTITKPRNTKKGDYRPPPAHASGKHRISINEDLNPYAFLITLLHEVAHLQTHEKYNLNHIKPHGPEWKWHFRTLLKPFQDCGCFPEHLDQALTHYMQNPAAATCSSPELTRALSQYDPGKDHEAFISDIKMKGYFLWRNRRFQRLNKQRTRYEALEVDSGRYYRFSQQARVVPL